MPGMVASKCVESARDAFPNAGNEAPLFDYLVSAGEDRLRHVEAERLGGVKVDDHFDLHRLLLWLPLAVESRDIRSSRSATSEI
jgi:hypothetical protein